MIEILRFIFSDPLYFLGTLAILSIIAWGISNFTLVRINISKNITIPDKKVEVENGQE